MGLWDGLRSAVRIVGGAVLVAVGVFGNLSGGWGSAFIAVGMGLLSAESSSQAARTARNKARDAYNESLQDRKQMVRSATTERRLIYGTARVSGPILYVQSTGDKKQYLHLVVALAGHECDAITEVWLGDTKLPDPDASGNILTGAYAKGTVATATQRGSGSSITLANTPTSIKSVVITGGRGGTAAVTYTQAGNVVTFVSDTGSNIKTVVYEYEQPGTPLVRIKKYLGTSTQTADADLISESGGKWTSAHRLRGVCYLYVRLQYDDDVFGSTGIPNISAVVRGKKVLDTRTGITAWSDNSALCLADYLRDATYGLGCSAAEVPAAEVSAAANVCDQTVTTPSGATEKRYTCNGALSSADTALQNKSALEQSMAGTAVWTQGRWLILPGASQAVDMDLDEDDFADGSAIKIVPAQARQQLRNRIVPTYVEPEQLWAETQAPAATRSGYVAADGGYDIPEEVTLRMVTGSERAQRLAFIELDRARQAMVVEAPFKLQAYNVQPGRWVRLTVARYGWTNKTFEVISRSLDFSKMQISMRLQEAADVYTPDPDDMGTVDLTPNTSLPSATAVPNALAGLSVASGTNHLLLGSDGTIITRGYVTWTQSDNAFVVSGGRVELETMLADGNAATDWVRHAPVDGAATSAYVAPLMDQRLTLMRVRPVTNRGRTGPWAYYLFLPVGKSAAPSNVSGAAYTPLPGGGLIRWTRPTDLDWAETEWRLGASWAAGTRVFRGSATEFALAGQSIGTVQLWGVNYDTSGNPSTTPANLTVVITETTEAALAALSVAVGHAQDDAIAANTALANIASDSILSPSEKPSVVQDYAVIIGEQAGIDAQAAAYGVTTERTAYASAVSALTSYLGTLSGWNTVPGADVAIVGTTFRGKFADVYTSRQALLNRIAAVAGTLSSWTGVSGRPDVAGNLIRKSSFEDGSIGTWGGASIVSIGGKAWTKALSVTSRDTLESSSDFPVTPGETIYVAADIAAGPSYNTGLGLMAVDSSGAVVGWLLGASVAAGAGWSRVGGAVTVPATAIKAVPWIQIDGPGGTALNQCLYANLYIGRQQLGATLGAPAGTPVAGVDASTVRDNAANALTNAGTALSTLATMRSNGYIDAAEKPAIIREWTALSSEQGGIDAQATSYGITTEKSAYDSALAALASYLVGLSPSWSDTTVDTPITPATDAAAWLAVYSARQTLLNKIAQVAGTLAVWGGVSGSGKPADNATQNLFYSQSADPGAVPDGALWKDTSGSPAVVRMRFGGAWVAASNLTTGQLAMLDSVGAGQINDGAVGTPKLGANAATVILSTTASGVSVLQASGAPLSAASITFTAEYDCTVQVTVTCTAEQDCTAEQWSTYGLVRVNSVAGSFTSDHQMTRNYSTGNGYDAKTVSRAYNTSHPAGVTRTYYFAVGADVATGSGRSATVNNVLMRLEAILK